ncbi:flocculation protein FLO11 [Drosophila sechellia]|uniref:flocculation protein FLO11 n=1 Tax=Drosophila sechellia TaxID=7238 RepID=UPI0013DDE1B0|nr:flocculation protein FLO11 [Drosophila sechellia]
MTTTTSPRETTQTTFTVRKMTGRRMSKLSTVLLFCAALLLTKSCGILALSGDGLPQSQDVGQAELWSDATTTIISPSEESSGSGGWELTTEADTSIPSEETTAGNEETTVSEEETSTDASEDVETTTAAPETSPADQESSSAPEETTSVPEETTSAPEESSSAPEESSSAPEATSSAPETTAAPEDTSSAPDQTSSAPEESSAAPEETSSAPEQTSSAPEETPSAPAEPESSSSSSSASPSTPAGTTIAPTPPTFKCQTAGLFPHISGDCSRYHNCLLNPVLRQLQDIELTCPELTVFSPSLGRCVRDLAECQAESFPCLSVGRFAGLDETYYYSCVASLQGGFHKFIVRCSSGQRFEPLIGGCWRYDWTQIVPGQEATEISDLAAIKRELKLYKAEAKLRLKAQKEQEKLAKKQQKLEEKAAKKAAKEQAKQQAKAEKDKAKGESIESVESAE